MPDEPFVKTGVSQTLPLKSQGQYLKQLIRLRFFPEGIRNCYTIGVSKGTRYLIKARFYYGNYDGKNSTPVFHLHLGSNFWDTITFINNMDFPTQTEIIHVAQQNYVRVCVADIGKGTPFISALELRPLTNITYVTEVGMSLKFVKRVDLGSMTNKTYRFATPFLFDIFTSIEQLNYVLMYELAKERIFRFDLCAF